MMPRHSLPGAVGSGVAEAFGRAAEGYDAHADLQARVAARLGLRIAGLGLPAQAVVLELGCGTGLLSGAVRAALPDAWLLASDLAPFMLRTHRAMRRDAADARIAMDGERPAIGDGGVDLVCASLVMQWFADAPAALSRLYPLLRPGGVVAFATLGPGTLASWRAALAAEGVPWPGPDFIAPALLRAAWPGPVQIELFEDRQACGSARDFVAGLRGLGAATPRVGHATLGPRVMHRVLARFQRDGAVAEWHVVQGICRRG